MSFISEFKEFALKGNLVDMAIGVVMGTAFGKVISAFVGGMVMPAVGMLASGMDFNKLVYTLKPGVTEVKDAAGTIITAGIEPVNISYGSFITVIIDFLIVALVIFMVIKGMNSMKKKQEAAPAAPAAPPANELLLAEIRDLLKK